MSVLPLEVYNDVQQLAAPALAAPHLVPEAEADAELCLRKLIINLGNEVSHLGLTGPSRTQGPPPLTLIISSLHSV